MNLKWLVDYRFWIFFILISLFLLWVFFGGEKQEFVGLNEVFKKEKEEIKALYVEDWREKYGHKIKQSNPEEFSSESETEICQSKNLTETTRVVSDNSYSVSETTLLSENINGQVAFSGRKKRKISKGEAECKRCVEKIYGRPFECVRPDWLRNPETNRKLEIDCYNDDIKVGVEYNGIQHYIHPNFTNQSQEDFIKQIRRDRLKLEICDKNGVYLITVPYTVKLPDIYNYIMERLPPEE